MCLLFLQQDLRGGRNQHPMQRNMQQDHDEVSCAQEMGSKKGALLFGMLSLWEAQAQVHLLSN